MNEMRQQSNVTINVDNTNATVVPAYMCRQYTTGLTVWGHSAIIEKENEEAKRLGKTLKNVPKYISFSQLTEEVLKQAEEDAKAELKAEGKPEQIWDKIVPGKLQRFISDNTTLDQEKALLDQNFIKDDSKKVSDYVSGYNVEITGFKRVALG